MENIIIATNEFFNQHQQNDIGVGAASFLAAAGRFKIFIVLQWISTFFQETHATQSSNHSLLLYLIPLLLEFVELKYQVKSNTPFETHPFSMYATIFTLFAYCGVSHTMLRIPSSRNFQLAPTYTSIYKFFIFGFGYFSVASLMSILWPEKVYFVPYVVYFMIVACKLLHLIMSNDTIIMDDLWHFQQSVATIWRRLLNSLAQDGTSILPLYVVQRNTSTIRH